MRKVAVFLDAGYFWVQVSALVLGTRGSRCAITLDYEKMRDAVLQEVANQFNGADLLRVYWYDGPGSNGKTQDHISVERLDDFKLRLGTRNGAGQQKAVDGLIIADMISLTQSRAITDALLVTGDADMTPGVVAAQAMGLRVHLLSIGPAAATSPHLAAEVDRKRTWEKSNIEVFAQPSPGVAAPVVCATGVSPPAASATPHSLAPTGAGISVMASSTVPAQIAHIPQQEAIALPYPAVAQAIHARLRSGPHAALLVGLSASTIQLPREIDGTLLSMARDHAKRTLTEVEKRSLRAEFKRLL